MSEDRVTLNDIENWSGADYALGLVDEVVVSDALVHFEMFSDTSAYLTARNCDREVFLRFHSRPTTRSERRQILASSQETLRDHLAELIPRRLGGRTWWSLPWYRRPDHTVRSWWAARAAAGAALTVDCEYDEEIT